MFYLNVLTQIMKQHLKVFFFSQWQPTGKTNQCAISFYYATYRCLAAALFLSILVASGTTSESPTYWFIYLTDLGFLIQTLHLVTSAAVIVQQLVHYHTGLALKEI